MTRALGTSVFVVLSVVVACSSESESGPGNGSSTSSSGGASSSGTASSSGVASSSGEPDACAPVIAAAESLPLDLHILLDASGTMLADVGGTPKWTRVKDALKAFVADPKNADVGFGLQTFPIVHANAPTQCSTDNDCAGGYGPCFKKGCDTGVHGSLLPCETSADCPGGAACGALIACGPSGACVQNGTSSPYGCTTIGCGSATTPFDPSFCSKKECFLEDYDDARVPISALPGSAAGFTTNLDAVPTPTQSSLTPTSAALAGGLAYATQYAMAHRDRAVAVVLVSDGSPNRCPPYTGAGMASFVGAAYTGEAAVRTFVVGVVIPQTDTAANALFEAIASAGGTTGATLIAPQPNATSGTQAALDGIRATAACTLKLPTSEVARIGLRSTDGTPIAKKAGATGCDASGGFYYDVDPAAGAPKKILLCPATCAAVKGGTKLETTVACP